MGNPWKNLDPTGKTVVTISGGPPADKLGIVRTIDDQFITMEAQFDKHLIIPTEHYKSGVSTEEVQQFIESQSDSQPVVIMGYSWGGGDALRVAKELEDNGIHVDSVITIDPYQWPNEFPDSAPEGGLNLNFYQTQKGFKGEEKGNMLNYNIGKIDKDVTHHTIDNNQYVQKQIVSAVNAIHKNNGGSWSRGYYFSSLGTRKKNRCVAHGNAKCG